MEYSRWYSQSNNAAKISSLFGLLLEPLEGGVFRSGGSKYDNNSIGSTTLSGSNCNEEETNGISDYLQMGLVDYLHLNHYHLHHQ